MTYVGMGAVMIWLTVFPFLMAVLGLFQIRRSWISGAILFFAGLLSVLVCLDAWTSGALLNQYGPDVKRTAYFIAYLFQSFAMVQRAIVNSWGRRDTPDALPVSLAEKATAATVWLVLILLLLTFPSLMSFGRGLGQI